MNINNSSLGGVASTNSVEVMARSNIHVLVVEHENVDHDNIINFLNSLSYKVTSVKFLSSALSILSKGKARYDLVMVNVNSPDSPVLRLQLLEYATKMNLLVIFMTNMFDGSSSMEALEKGAFLTVRKPLSMVILETLSQLVLHEKKLQPGETESFTKSIDNGRDLEEEHFGRYMLMKNKQNPNLEGVIKERNCINSEIRSDSGNESGGYKRKVWTEWTVDLHNKFMDAVNFLGPGRCYPKDILDIMNVPGLTRMQVASHLQKCRSAKWVPPNERKLKGITKRETNLRARRPLQFGLMPNFREDKKKHSHSHQTIPEYISIDDDDDDDHDHTRHQQPQPQQQPQQQQQQQQLLVPQSNTDVFGHDHAAGGSNDTRVLDLGIGFGFDSDKMDHQFDDYNLPDFSTNNDAFQLLSLIDSPNVHPFVPNSQQKDLEMKLDDDDDWNSFLLEYGGDNHKVAEEANQGFQDGN